MEVAMEKETTMSTVDMPYFDAAIEHMEAGGPPDFWRHMHWAYFDDPENMDDDLDRYYAAAAAMVERILVAGEVADGRRILDVGCGFGGTIEHLRGRHGSCTLTGLNIDERQLQWARRLQAPPGDEVGPPAAWIRADGCKLPVADASLDHVLAVECVFHFPSRKQFFREASRVLKPGGTLAMSDFLLAPGSLETFVTTGEKVGLGDGAWYGPSAKPLTPAGYQRLGRGTGFDQLVDEDVTPATMPTYPAHRRLYHESDAARGIIAIDALEILAGAGGWEYHVLSFRKR
jgi:SAM-dependent methyltransferase